MSINRIQFQRGLSLTEFLKLYGMEAQCEAALEEARWPEGFVCPCCGGKTRSVFKADSHNLYQCKACRHQTSLTAGTLFQKTKLPLTTWFLAIYLVSQAKAGLSALALKWPWGSVTRRRGSCTTSSWRPWPSAKAGIFWAAKSKLTMPTCTHRA